MITHAGMRHAVMENATCHGNDDILGGIESKTGLDVNGWQGSDDYWDTTKDN